MLLKSKFWRDDVRRAPADPVSFHLGHGGANTARSSAIRLKGSIAHVTNGMAFSYPGYNEMTVGFPDPQDRQATNSGPNPNVTRVRMAQQVCRSIRRARRGLRHLGHLR